MNKIITSIILLVFPTILFLTLWCIILSFNDMFSLLIIPFFIMFFVATGIYIMINFRKNKSNLWLMPISFIIFYLFLLLGDTSYSDGLTKYMLSTMFLVLYCMPFFVLTSIATILMKIRKFKIKGD